MTYYTHVERALFDTITETIFQSPTNSNELKSDLFLNFQPSSTYKTNPENRSLDHIHGAPYFNYFRCTVHCIGLFRACWGTKAIYTCYSLARRQWIRVEQFSMARSGKVRLVSFLFRGDPIPSVDNSRTRLPRDELTCCSVHSR